MHPPDPFAHRYTNLRLVGRGGFGAVYRASDGEMEREVALKLLNPELAADADWRRRFRQEATAASKLNHPNITIVFDRGEFQDQPFIVMEFVEGETLSKIIDHGVSLTDPERIALLEQLCDGLHYAHQRDIVHRDIKPVNLIVREDDDGSFKVRTLKILDFGIAKVADSGHTATGSMMFTPAYVSPEQVLGEETDRRVDIFAVGAVAYELLVLQKAFNITSKNPFTVLEQVRRKIVEEAHPPMTSVRPDIDPELSAIVDRALAKAPADRYRDLAEMRRRLRKVRERLEEAMPATSETTVIIAPRTQGVMRQARQALEAGDASAAVTQLQQAIAATTNDGDRRALEVPLRQAIERQAAIRAERKAHDEAAARAAISMATAAFVEGDRTSAIRALGQFEPSDLVAQELALLARAAAAISAAERTIEHGDADARVAALVQLESFTPENLIESALARLRNRVDERLAAEQQAADHAIDEARADFTAGRREDAIAALEGFMPAPLVAPALSELHDAKARIDHAVRAVLGGAAEDRHRALAGLEAFWPAELVAGTLLELRARAAERLAAERRIEEEVDAAQTAAVKSFVAGSREQAIAQLTKFSDPVKVAATVERLRDAARAIDHAEAAVREGGREDRARALAKLESFEDNELVAPSLAALRAIDARRCDAEDRDATAAEAVRRAREQFDQGERTTAIGRLEAFSPPHRAVREAIDELRAKARHLKVDADRSAEEKRLADEARARQELADRIRVVQAEARGAFVEGRRDRALAMLGDFQPPEPVAELFGALRTAAAAIDAATAGVTAEGASAPARRAALERLARLEPQDLYAHALADLRTVDNEGTASEAKVEAERLEREEQANLERLKAQAQQAVTAAQAQFIDGAYGPAIDMLAAFQPSSLVAERLALLRRAKGAIDQAREVLVRGDAAARLRAIELLLAFQPNDLVDRAASQLRSAHLRRSAEEQQAALQPQARNRADQIRPEAKETRDRADSIAATARTGRVRRAATRFVAPALAAGLLIVGLYQLLPLRDTATNKAPTVPTVPTPGPPPQPQLFQFEVQRPSGGTIRIGDKVCGGDLGECRQTFPQGHQVDLRAEASPGYEFRSFTGDCASDVATLRQTISADMTCGAAFTLKPAPPPPGSYTLAIRSQVGGVVEGDGFRCRSTGGDCTKAMVERTAVTLRAKPDADFRFDGWRGGCVAKNSVSKATALRITVDQNVDCVATFSSTLPPPGPETPTPKLPVTPVEPTPPVGTTVPPPPAIHTLTFNLPDHGSLHIPDRLNCGKSGTDCSVQAPAGTQLAILVTAEADYMLQQSSCGEWSHDRITLRVDTSRTCTVTFIRDPSKVTPPSKPPVVTPGPSPAEVEARQQIVDVVTRYGKAIASRKVNEVAALYESYGARDREREEGSFRTYSSIEWVQGGPVAIDLSLERRQATATVSVKKTLVDLRSQRPTTNNQNYTFDLVLTPSGWRIRTLTQR